MIELLTVAEMAEADRATCAAGTPGRVLMERAGRAVAAEAALLVPRGAKILVLCGPGNNGGDGYVAARVLEGRGFEIRVASLAPPEASAGDAAFAAAAWNGPVVALSEARAEGHDLVVDALFGAGLSRDPEGAAAEAVERLARSGRPILAVDVPSGVDGDSGRVRGAAARATRTVTFFRRKPAHLLEPGRSLCGDVVVADIGIAADVLDAIGPRIFENRRELHPGIPPSPDPLGHKYGRGHALVLSGGIEGAGAARLAARAALRIGAGLVTVATPTEALAVQAAALTAIMVRRADGIEGFAEALADPRRNAVVIGPAAGIGEETRAKTAASLRGRRAAVLDADALTSFEGRAADLAALTRAAQGPVVLTPHDGEFTRLFNSEGDIAHIPSKVGRAQAASAFLGATIVLKGPDTVIAAPDGRAAINANGTPYLATAGSGDVLAGFVGGLLAQGVAGFGAACAAVRLHAECARAFGPGLVAEDLAETLPLVLAAERDA